MPHQHHVKSIVHPVTGQTFKLGRHRPVARGPRLKLGNYLKRKLPAPTPCDWRPNAANALSQIYLNDQLGDCVIAGMAHVVGVLTGNANNPGGGFIYTNDQITQLYSAIGGYVPGDPSTDQGCDEVTALNYWQENGAPAGSHQIAGSLSVDGTEPDEYRTAVALFMNLYFGVELPDSWVNPMPSGSGFIWDVAGDPDPENGHCFIGDGSMWAQVTDGGIIIDTWGMSGLVTDAAMAKYTTASDGGQLFTVVSKDMLLQGSQTAPNHLDWTQLIADFDAMGGNISP